MVDSPGFFISSRKMTINQSTEFEDDGISSIYSSQESILHTGPSSQESILNSGPVNIVTTKKYFKKALDANIYDIEQNNYTHDEEALEARDYFDGPEDQSAQLVSQGKQTAIFDIILKEFIWSRLWHTE